MAVPTTVGSVPAQETIVSSTVTLNVSGYFSDIDAGNSLFFSITGLPTGTGLSISSTTGVITGTPTAADLAESFDVTVTATDEQNRARNTTVSFIVSTAPSAAQNYYINGSTGNDAWDGSSATFTSGTTGPWRTISRANTVNDHASGHTDIWIAPGNYRNQPWVPQNGGADTSHRIRLRVNGTGIVYILGPSSGQILYGMYIEVDYVSVLREDASSYFLIDGEVVFGTAPGQVAKNGEPETVAHLARGLYVDATGVVIDMDCRRTAGWVGLDLGVDVDQCEFAINWVQHGTSHYSDGNDFGDVVWIDQTIPVGS